MMRFIPKFALPLLLTAITAGATLFAPKPCDIQLVGSTYVTSEYVFRGKKQASASIQPSVTLALPVLEGQLYAKTWMNFPIHQQKIATKCNCVSGKTGDELDFTIGYQIPLAMSSDDLFSASEGVLSIDLGYTYYYYPNQSAYYNFNISTPCPSMGAATQNKSFGLNRAHEIFIGLRGNVIAKPSLYTYYDFSRAQWVFQGNISHSFPLDLFSNAMPYCQSLSFDIGAYIGYLIAHDYLGDQTRKSYNQFAPLAPDPKWNNSYCFGGLTADLVCHINDHMQASIGLRYAGNNDGDSAFGQSKCIRPSIGGHEDLFWWTTGVDFNF